GCWADWEVKTENNLCTTGGPSSKVAQFLLFMQGPDAVLVCTHATLRFAFEKLAPADFDGTVLAIDEFHHVSADTDSSRLGSLLADVMEGADGHVVAMAGSDLRGDRVPMLVPEGGCRYAQRNVN